MARQAGPNYFIGRIGNMIYYKSNGVFLVKNAPEKDKKISSREKGVRKIKEGRIEFGGGAVLSKAFRDSFASCIEPYNNRALAGKLTGKFRKIIQMGSGKEGMRDVEILKNKNELAGFEFHKDYKFDQIFKAPLKWEVKKDRNEVVLVIPPFTTKGYVSKPIGATHFRIILTVGIIADYFYSKQKKKYVPNLTSLNGKSFEVCTEYLSLKSAQNEIHLPVKFTSGVPEGYSLIACILIEFYKEETGQKHSLQTKRAMKIAEVF